MHDIYVAIVVMCVFALAAFLLCARIAGRVPRRGAMLGCVLIVAYLLAHRWLVSDQVWITRLMPVSNVVIFGNPLPIAVAALAGLAWRLMPGGAARKSVLIVPLVCLCVYRSFAPAFVTPPIIGESQWRDGVCLQTSAASCSPAAAATLLRVHGIDASESEMARLCLTSERGTTMHGLYRGLKLKTANTDWTIEPFHTDSTRLRKMDGPMILSVRLDRHANVDPRYEQQWGWMPGVAHHIVFFQFTDNGEKCEMGDPSVGREKWSARDIGVLWHGDGLRLVKR